jgi:hypothetical protein
MSKPTLGCTLIATPVQHDQNDEGLTWRGVGCWQADADVQVGLDLPFLQQGAKEAGKRPEVRGTAAILRFLAAKPVFAFPFSPLLTEPLRGVGKACEKCLLGVY